MRRAFWIAVLITGLSSSVLAASGGNLEIIDQTGAVVLVELPVERVVSVYGMGTYYLYALGAEDLLVGGGYVGVKSVPQASEALVRLEPRLEELFVFGDPSPEEILLRDPDLILTDASRHAAFAEQMSDLGVPTLQYVVETSDEMREALRLTALAFGPEAQRRSEAFDAELERIFHTIETDLERLAIDERVRVLFLGTSPELVASGDMYQTELIERAGGRSVSGGLVGYWNEVNLEQVLAWNPDVIIIPPYGPVQPEDLLENPDWASVGAVQSGRVHRMPRIIAPMDTPVPESLVGVVWLAHQFYPDRISLDIVGEAASFYETFYDLELTEAERGLLGTP